MYNNKFFSFSITKNLRSHIIHYIPGSSSTMTKVITNGKYFSLVSKGINENNEP